MHLALGLLTQAPLPQGSSKHGIRQLGRRWRHSRREKGPRLAKQVCKCTRMAKMPSRFSSFRCGASRATATAILVMATAFCSAPGAIRPKASAGLPSVTTIRSQASGAGAQLSTESDAAVPVAGPSSAPQQEPTVEPATAKTTDRASTSRPGWGKTIAIPAGRFTFGGSSHVATEGQASNKAVELALVSRPPRTARLVEVNAFDIDFTEVTVEAYQRCLDSGECLLEPMTYEFCTWDVKGRSKHPVNCVGRYHAEQFCAWAGGRLPTEEEWEYAARGSDERIWPWGNVFSPKGLCFNRSRSKAMTCAVGSSARDVSSFGVRDMAASVTEWTQSELWVVKPEEDKNGLGEGYSVVRGGGWSDVEPMRASVHAESFPSWTDVRADRGFRCVYPSRP